MIAPIDLRSDTVTRPTAAMRAGWDASDHSTDDEADAWWLWALGRHLLGDPVVESTQYRQAIIDTLDPERDYLTMAAGL